MNLRVAHGCGLVQVMVDVRKSEFCQLSDSALCSLLLLISYEFDFNCPSTAPRSPSSDVKAVPGTIGHLVRLRSYYQEAQR